MSTAHLSAQEFVSLLRKSRRDKDLAQALRLYDAVMSQSGLEAHSSHLVSVLVELGSMSHARQIFDKMGGGDELLWSAIIVGYVKHEEPQHALSLYQVMHANVNQRIHPTDIAFVALLKACALLYDLKIGHRLHVEIARKGLLEKNVFISCSLVDMYAKCGFLTVAHEVFKGLPTQDTVSWNALITGYAECGCEKEALACFEQMQQEGVSGNAVTFVCGLKACAGVGLVNKGQEVHAEVVMKGFELDTFIRNCLVDMYAKCGLLSTAREVFKRLPSHDVVSWNTLFGGLTEQGHCEEVLCLLQQMQHEGISLNYITCTSLLKACGGVGSIVKGQELHAEIVNRGMDRGPLLGSSLVDMYAKCGLLVEAQEVLNRVPGRDVVSWTAIMAGYAERGQGEDVLDCFNHMKNEGISPDAHAFSCSLKACGSIEAIDKGRELHGEIAGKGLESELLVGNTLVNMYASFGLLATAQDIFNKLPVQDMMSLNALTVGYTVRGWGKEALECYDHLQLRGIPLNSVTCICSLKACCSTGSIVKGKRIHIDVAKTGLEQELPIGNTLIDLYVKSSLLAEAKAIFDNLVTRDVISWTALMAGYAQLGESEDVFLTFDQMLEEGIKPNLVTFVHVLNACNHAGLVRKGQIYFEAISQKYGLNAELDHYTCMIDLLGRAGHIVKALSMIKKMPMQPDLVVWHTVLGACRKWYNVNLGRVAFEHAVRLDERVAATYLFMFNIYMDAGMHEDADKIEAMRNENLAWA